MPGTQVHDAIQFDQSEANTENAELSRAKKLARPTNRAGGLEGGVSNGQPLIIRAAMKPIATTLNPQQTVDLATGQETKTVYERSDFCPVPRAVPIIEGVAAFILADALLEKLGGDSLLEMKERFERLRNAAIDDLPMDNLGHTFWPGD
jgi:chorismate synthase